MTQKKNVPHLKSILAPPGWAHYSLAWQAARVGPGARKKEKKVFENFVCTLFGRVANPLVPLGLPALTEGH